jgi:2'-5' RNA ligase
MATTTIRDTRVLALVEMSLDELRAERARLEQEIDRLGAKWNERPRDPHATHLYAHALRRFDEVVKRLAEVGP